MKHDRRSTSQYVKRKEQKEEERRRKKAKDMRKEKNLRAKEVQVMNLEDSNSYPSGQK